jgi:hypothetical protein
MRRAPIPGKWANTHEEGAPEMPTPTSKIAFAELRLAVNGQPINAPAPAIYNEVDPAWITTKSREEFRQLVAQVDTDNDPNTGEAAFSGYDTAFNLSDRFTNNAVTSLATDNTAADPVIVTAAGMTSGHSVGDLTGAVVYDPMRGFSLDSGPDRAAMARRLNDGDSTTFHVPQGELSKVSFTVATHDPTWSQWTGLPGTQSSIALDVDGDTIINPTGTTSGFEDNSLVLLSGIADGQQVEIDFGAQTLMVNNVAQAVDAGFWQAFDAAGGDTLTIGTPLGESSGFAIQDLVLTTGAEDVPLEEHFVSGLNPAWSSQLIGAGDIDGDGNMDVVASTRLGQGVFWYESSGGSDPTYIGHHIVNPGETRSISAVDVDGDGDTDIVTGSGFGDLRWYENNGATVPSFTRHVIPSRGNDFYNHIVADFDGDGDMDIATHSGFGRRADDHTLYFENVGGAVPVFQESRLETVVDMSHAIAAGDMDGDGDLDIVLAGKDLNPRNVWYQQVGVGTSTFQMHPLSQYADTTNGSLALALGDLDGDGDLDVVESVTTGATGVGAGRIHWQENNGAATPTFTGHLLATGGEARGLAATDFDGDGDMDVVAAETFLSANGVRGEFAWYENDGAATPGFNRHTIAETEDPPSLVNFTADVVSIADFDGDGDPDVLGQQSVAPVSDPGVISWFENPFGAPQVRQTIAFGELRLAVNGQPINAPAPAIFNEIDPAWITTRNRDEFRQLVALVDTDNDPNTGEAAFSGYDTALNLSDKAANNAVASLATDNVLPDPVIVTATGMTSGQSVGDLTGSVIYDPVRGFSLDNGPDRTAMARRLNDGDSTTFRVPQGELSKASFTVATHDPSWSQWTGLPGTESSIALDVDGDTIINPTGTTSGFEDNSLVLLSRIADGQQIDIDFEAQTLMVDNVAQAVDAGFWQAFHAAGSDTLTIGTPLGESSGFTIQDLVLTSSAEYGNGQGYLDLATADIDSDTASIRMNDGNGVFTGSGAVAVGNGPESIALGDLDGDGDLDLVTSNVDGDTVSVRLNDGNGNFTGAASVVVGNGPRWVTLGDVDGDRDLDIVTADLSARTASIRLNKGDATFTGTGSVSVGYPFSVALGDLDSDGDLDLVAADLASHAASIRINDGKGNFSGTGSVPLGSSPYSATLGDVDGDGDLDLVSADLASNAVSIRLNDGNGTFSGTESVAVGRFPNSVALGDLDSDGDLDLASADTSSDTVSIRLNDGTGKFSGIGAVVVGDAPRVVALGDIDGDGDLDLVTADGGDNAVSIRLNDGNGAFFSFFGTGSVAVGDSPRFVVLGKPRWRWDDADCNGFGLALPRPARPQCCRVRIRPDAATTDPCVC